VRARRRRADGHLVDQLAAQEEVDEPFIAVVPDCVCEIVSTGTLGTLRIDRMKKMPIDAREKVGHVWLVDSLGILDEPGGPRQRLFDETVTAYEDAGQTAKPATSAPCRTAGSMADGERQALAAEPPRAEFGSPPRERAEDVPLPRRARRDPIEFPRAATSSFPATSSAGGRQGGP